MKYVNCNLCGADNWTVRYASTLNGSVRPKVEAFRCTSAEYGEHTQIVQCHECGYVYSNPTWDSDELLSAYNDVEDTTYVNEHEGRILTFSKHLQALEKVAGSGQGRTLLDVGAYTGVFVEVACQAGWDAVGIEPSNWAVAQAQSRGVPVLQGTLSDEALQTRTFDVVTLWDVIEHVDDPAEILRQSFERLKPGGMLAIHTMDIDSLTARLMGARWPWLMAMHIHYFSKQTLAEMVRRIGFDVAWIGTEGRYLRMGYLATRLGGLSSTLGRVAQHTVDRFGWTDVAVPVNFGDLFTVYAVRPKISPSPE